MKRNLLIWTIIISLLMPGLAVSAAGPRVIATVKVVADNSADVKLQWSDGSTNEAIMITSWLFEDEDQLLIYYRTGSDVPTGFAQRIIRHDSYSFPMKIRLERSTGHTPEFSDINDSDPGQAAILNLYYRGIIGGYPDGTFKPKNKVTRAEFSKMMLLTADYEEAPEAVSIFSDVSQDFWGRRYIMPLAAKGILKGKGEGLFDPNGQIKVGEVLAVLTRTFNLFEGDGVYPYTLKSHWSNEAFLTAVEDGILLPTDSFYQNYDPEVPATREQCAVLLSRVLENLHDVTQ